MVQAKLKPHQMPDWPRLMGRLIAAAYCGVSAGTFDRMVREQKYPPPIREGRTVLWDRVMIDEIIDLRSNCADHAGGWDGSP